MKNRITVLLLGGMLVVATALSAQSNTSKSYRNFPIIVTVQFHNLSLPFQDLGSNFSNVGIGLGTEVSLNGKHNWAQQFSIIWYRNKFVGNGLLLYSQSVWRPTLVGNAYGELKAGAGYLHAFRPSESYRQINGNWISVGHKGKGMFALPMGVSLGYDNYSTSSYVSPFASYQLLLVKNYNQSIPLVPMTLVQVGSRVHPKY